MFVHPVRPLSPPVVIEPVYVNDTDSVMWPADTQYDDEGDSSCSGGSSDPQKVPGDSSRKRKISPVSMQLFPQLPDDWMIIISSPWQS